MRIKLKLPVWPLERTPERSKRPKVNISNHSIQGQLATMVVTDKNSAVLRCSWLHGLAATMFVRRNEEKGGSELPKK
jgi:hypothetical protein